MDPDQIVRRCLTIKGSHNYRPEDLITATRFMYDTQDKLPWEQLVGGVFSLEDCNEAIQFAKDHPGQRAILQMC
jgi:alcohol dehydrogenase